MSDSKPGESLAQIVRRIREQNGWTLNSVARQSGDKISGSYISLIEIGRNTNPTPEKLQALAEGLRVDVSVLNKAVYGTPSALSATEETLVSAFRRLDTRGQRDSLVLLSALTKTIEADNLPASPANNHDIDLKRPKKKKLKNRK